MMENVFTVNTFFFFLHQQKPSINFTIHGLRMWTGHFGSYSWIFTSFSISELNIKHLLCFCFAGIYDWLSSSGRSSCSGGGGGALRGSRRKRIGIINQGLPPLSLLNHLNQAVGHKHDDDGGYREA